jgi:hypothetical protein
MVNLPKATDEQKRSIAQQYGVKFIRLTTKNPINTEYRELPWQTVRIAREAIGKKVSINLIWSVGRNGDAKGDGALEFVPNAFGMGEAFVPDSPYNRIKIAACIYARNEAWTIDDPAIRKEIDKIVREMENDPELKKKEQAQAAARVANEKWVKEQEEKRRPKDAVGLNGQLQQIVDVLAKLTSVQLAQVSSSIQDTVKVLEPKPAERTPAEVPEPRKKPTADRLAAIKAAAEGKVEESLVA